MITLVIGCKRDYQILFLFSLMETVISIRNLLALTSCTNNCIQDLFDWVHYIDKFISSAACTCASVMITLVKLQAGNINHAQAILLRPWQGLNLHLFSQSKSFFHIGIIASVSMHAVNKIRTQNFHFLSLHIAVHISFTIIYWLYWHSNQGIYVMHSLQSLLNKSHTSSPVHFAPDCFRCMQHAYVQLLHFTDDLIYIRAQHSKGQFNQQPSLQPNSKDKLYTEVM